MERAYATLTVKAVEDEDARLIEGIASTPTPDRMDDVVEPMGAEFKTPMALLWQHRADEPVGWVEWAKPNKQGIPFKARLAKIADAGPLKDMVDKAWQAVKAGLVRGVSIGFRPKERSIIENGGYRFTKWEWMELSLVTIPANAEATITAIKSIDAELLAASGQGVPNIEPAEAQEPVASDRKAHVALLDDSARVRARAKPFVIRTIHR